jgi:plastocyanin
MNSKLLASAAAGSLIVACALLVACGNDSDGGGGGAEPAPSPTPAAQSVSLIDFGYMPSTLTARSGQSLTINLRNTGQAPHTFTIDGVVDSGTLASGGNGSVQFTPASPGTQTFYCTVHGRERMSGTLTVTP